MSVYLKGKIKLKAIGIAQWFRALRPLPEDLSLVAAPIMSSSQLPIMPIPGDLMPCSGLHGYLEYI